MAERCIFCGWKRNTSLPSIRFFAIPRDPGMKRLQWLYAIGNQEIMRNDRVCSVHFRSGRPSNDPSHEDFQPHLYLNKEPPPEILSYLESAVESDPDVHELPLSDNTVNTHIRTEVATANTLSDSLRTSRPNILKRRKSPFVSQVQRNAYHERNTHSEEPIQGMSKHASLSDISKVRKKFDEREEQSEEIFHESSSSDINCVGSPIVGYDTSTHHVDDAFDHHIPIHAVGPSKPHIQPSKNVRMTMISRKLAEAVGARHGQTVVFKRRVMVPKGSVYLHLPLNSTS